MSGNQDAAHQGLYYIYRTTADNNFDSEASNNNNSASGFNMNNMAYLDLQNRDDDPPNYYEAVLIKNRTHNQNSKLSSAQGLLRTPNNNINIQDIINSSNSPIISRNNEVEARTSLSSSSNDDDINLNLTTENTNSDRISSETTISSNLDELATLARQTEANISISNISQQHINSTIPTSMQMTAYINISESSDESLSSSGQSSDV